MVFQQFLELGFIGLLAMPDCAVANGCLLAAGSTFSSVTIAVLQRLAN